MPPQEQADLWMALRDRMKVDWNELTLQEKKAGKSMPSYSPMAAVWGRKSNRQECRRNAGRTRDSQDGLGCRNIAQSQTTAAITITDKPYTAYWIAFGPHGPRAGSPPGEGTKIFTYTVLGVAASLVIFLATHHFANPPPSTLNKEWQEATNEYFKVRYCAAK